MKYKVGDEVLVKAKIANVGLFEYDYVAELKKGSFLLQEDDIVQDPDMTAEEAWEIAKKLFADYSDAELDEIFGKGWSFPKLTELTPQEAKAKIQAWEAEKEIKVGDVVIETSGAGSEYTGVVTQITSAQKSVCIVYSDGSTNITLVKNIKMTGRHIDIDGLLKHIGDNKA